MKTEKLEMKFKVGDKVQSAPDGSDVKLMKMMWVAEVIELRGENEEGGCYETLGGWTNEPETAPLTLRQLWGSHLVPFCGGQL
jgi:hypothetical protein